MTLLRKFPWKKSLLGVGAMLLFFLLGTASGVALLAAFGDFPSIESAEAYRPSVSSKVYDRANRIVGEMYLEKRTVVPFGRIPRHVVNAFVAAEDKNFFRHKGVDLAAIARAAVKDLLRLGFAQGGSTITQQTVKNLFLTPERNIGRKLKEFILAVRIEKRLSKEEILYLYLNQIYLGEGTYGVEAASRTYFGKGVAEVGLAEAAVLAGLPKAPTRYSPRTNMDGAKARQRYVLREMVEAGFASQAEADRAEKARLVLAPPSTFRSKAAYFLEHVRLYVSERYGTDALYKSEMRIYTTIDGTLQEAAHDALLEGVRRTEERNRYKDLQGSILALDPRSGAILAMVGGTDFAVSQFNRALQARRQPGSSFKPFIYAAALNRGRTVVSPTDDSPIEFDIDEEEMWKPRNYDGAFLGEIPMLEALAQSRNLATIRLLNEIGIEPALQAARAAGIASPMERNLSIALGSSGVTLLEMCTAYATFAAGGQRPAPFFIREIRDAAGRVLERNGAAVSPALSPETAYLVTRMLQEVVRSGTGRAARGLSPHIAGKTGTTNENTDAWFIGFTPDLVAGVWVGFDAPRPLGDKESAAAVALPVWIAFMRKGLALFPAREFPVPPGVTFARVDPATGRSLPPGSADGVLLPFRIGTVPAALAPGSRPGRARPPSDDLL